MFVRMYTVKKHIVTVSNKLLKVRAIHWVQSSPNSSADKCLKTASVSRRGEPHHALVAYVTLARTTVLNISCNAFSSMPRLLRILTAWSDCAHLLTTCWQCSLTDSLLLIVTPRIFRLVTRSIPGSFDGGECVDLPLPLRLVIMISLVFLWFSFKLLFSAHCSTFWSSAARVWIFCLLG